MADGYCNSRVLEYSAQGEWRGEYVLPSAAGQPLRNPHSIVLKECARALYVAEREASRVHRFSLETRELEGMPFCNVSGCWIGVLTCHIIPEASGSEDALPGRLQAKGAPDEFVSVISSWPRKG